MPINFVCFVDESGQDTKGRLFIVAAVLSEVEASSVREFCEGAEESSGKGKVKWTSARFDYRLDYIGQILHHQEFRGRLFYAIFRDTLLYRDATVQTIGRLLETLPADSNKVKIFIDALPKSLERPIILDLRRSGANVEKVRGVARDENEALIRLADALCGLVRGAVDGHPDLQELLDWGIRTGMILDLTL
jgi:hypothetical protein